MDEVIDPAMTLKVTGLLGLKLCILYKIINAYIHKNNIYYFIGEKIKKNNYLKILRAFHTNFFRAKKHIGPHHQDVISVIVGSLLGVGHCNKRII
jgi:hypothetical protein